MVHYHVEDDSHPASVDFLDQLQGVAHHPVFGRDVGVVRNVVAEISLRRGKEWGNLNCLESQILNVIQFLDNALQVADAVAV